MQLFLFMFGVAVAVAVADFLKHLSGLDESGADFQVVDQRVYGALERRLQQQVVLGQRRLRPGQQGGPVLERAVQAQRHAAEDEAQHQQA